jgi:hypothetical protein
VRIKCDTSNAISFVLSQCKYLFVVLSVLTITCIRETYWKCHPCCADFASCSSALHLTTSHRIWRIGPYTNLHNKPLETDSIKPVTITVIELEIVMEDETGLHVGWHGYPHRGRTWGHNKSLYASYDLELTN